MPEIRHDGTAYTLPLSTGPVIPFGDLFFHGPGYIIPSSTIGPCIVLLMAAGTPIISIISFHAHEWIDQRDQILNDGKSCMTSLVSLAFSEWTDGLDTRQSMISIFTHIRDIPYSLSMPVSDTKTSPEQLLLAGKGSCGPKHHLLAEMYRKLNLSVVYATIAFSWNDPDLHYPPGLRKQATALPIAHHLACRVQVGCRWVLVDATWDRPLAPGGFPINDHWDGYSEMKWAVKPLKFPVRTAFCHNLTNEPCRAKGEDELCPTDGEKDHWDMNDQVRYYREKVAVRTPDEVKRLAQFYFEFDEWLADVRHMHV